MAEDEILLVVVGRLEAWLKLESLERTIVATGMLAQSQRVRLAIVGDGSARTTVEQLARSTNAAVGRRVVDVVGPMVDPRPAYAASDIMLGMGGSALRSMAFAKPLVVLGERGFSRVLDHRSAPLFAFQGWYGLGAGRPDDLVGSFTAWSTPPRSGWNSQRSVDASSRRTTTWTPPSTTSRAGTPRLPRPPFAGCALCLRGSGRPPSPRAVPSSDSPPFHPVTLGDIHMTNPVPFWIWLHARRYRGRGEARFRGADEPDSLRRRSGRARFRGGIRDLPGQRHCVGVANGTDAIELALRALRIGAGDEVIIPANTFIATAEAVVRAGAVPVVVDVDPSNFLMGAEQIEAVVGPRTAAVLPVHLYGQMAPMQLIHEVAGRHGLAVVEDAAQAQGAPRAAGASERARRRRRRASTPARTWEPTAMPVPWYRMTTTSCSGSG